MILKKEKLDKGKLKGKYNLTVSIVTPKKRVRVADNNFARTLKQ